MLQYTHKFTTLTASTASISTLSHISFFFSFSYSPPPSPLSHTLSSSLSPPIRSILSIQCIDAAVSLFLLRVANFLSILSQNRRVADRYSQSRRFAGKEVM
nr:hypothetical protein CFP56_26808 [Quercus suber]